MSKRIALLASAAALAVMPALAQQSTTPAQPAPSAMQPGQMTKSFIDTQTSEQWLASKLIGLKVVSGTNENIGSIDNLLVERNGNVVAAVIGVGGFLGIGQKDVAVPFNTLNVTRDPDGNEKVTVTLTKAELEKAPEFKPYEPARSASRPTTSPGSSPTTPKKPGNM